MNSFTDLARLRRSMRKFTEQPVTDDQLRQLMCVALMAPTGKSLHTWQFAVVRDKEKIEALSRCKEHGAEFVAGASAVIVVMADPAVSDVWVEDASVATTMLLLQAEDMGLGACWVQVRLRKTADGRDAEQVVRETLGVPESLRVLSLVPVGYKGMERKPINQERLLWDKVSGL